MSNGMGSFGTEFRYRNLETGNMDGNYIKVDYAKIAEGYGAKTYKVNNIEDLRLALEDSKKQATSTLIDIKVMPKTMTNGYKSWWNVGVAENISEDNIRKDSILESYKEKKEALKRAKKY